MGIWKRMFQRGELGDVVAETAALPPWPGPLETLGKDGLPYAQLHADLWTLERHLAAGRTWAQLPAVERGRLWHVYPEYVFAATRQRVMQAAAEAGITTTAQAWGYWTRRWGDPLLEARRNLEWFLRDIEAAP